ncbi:TPA: N-6 DNA methylase [Streptococcus suis]|nr:N-6 DNA methylase [Streptococcus suis]
MENFEDKKNRGGYYTPNKVADFIVSWAIDGTEKKILEPSCGDGVFIKSIANNSHSNLAISKIIGVELNKNESEKAKMNNIDIINSDFFTLYKEHLKKTEFDLILGNPPFIRYQNFNKDFRDIALEELRALGFSPTKMINIWLPFLILSTNLLNKNGRLGMVIPAELMQVDYASEAREFLMTVFEELTIITFKNNIFENAQQEVVLLLGKKSSESQGIRLIEVSDAEELFSIELDDYKFHQVSPSKDKWLKLFMDSNEFDEFEQLSNSPKILEFNNIAEVNVGVVTGQNKFFVINKDTVSSYNLSKSTIDIISRSEQLKGFSLNDNDIEQLYSNGKKTKLFFPDDSLLPSDIKYIDFGESNEFHLGYKTRIRKKWYKVPVSWSPQAFFLRQVHKFPKIVINETNSTCTDTIHKIRVKSGISIENLAFSFMNSFTLLDCELKGRSYGGGVLTFEPGEVRKLRIPYYNFSREEMKKIKHLSENETIENLVQYIDELILKNYLNLTDYEISLIKRSWEKLNQRRLDR